MYIQMYMNTYTIFIKIGSLLKGVEIFNKTIHKRNCKCSNQNKCSNKTKPTKIINFSKKTKHYFRL